MRRIPLWRVPPENAAKLPLYAFPIAAIATIVAVSAFGIGLIGLGALINASGSLPLQPVGGILFLSFIYSWAGFVVAFPIGLIARAKGYIGILCVCVPVTVAALLIQALTFFAGGDTKDPFWPHIVAAATLMFTFLIFAIPFWLILYFFWPHAFKIETN
jgi:hypothetical protein